jgi:hypothetical protein
MRRNIFICQLPAEKSGKQKEFLKNQKLLELYRAHQPYHEAAEKLVPAAR